MINFKKYNISITKFSKHESGAGFIALLNTILVLIFMLSLAMSMSILIVNRQKIATNTVKSTQSYYASQAGVEDALLRLKNNPQMPSLSYSIIVGNAVANVAIPAIIGGSRSISSQGVTGNLTKTNQVVYAIDRAGVSFHYGAQVGAGGMVMGNGSQVKGNVFSNGNITGSGTIDNDVIVAGNGHSVKDVSVGGNVLTYSCLSPAQVAGNLTYVTGGSHTCNVSGSTSVQPDEIATEPLPILQSQIDDWKNEAAAGSIITGDYVIDNGESESLGPVKITGKLTVSNGSTLTITGTIHIMGDIVFDNNSIITLDNLYGSLGGVILSDQKIDVKNNSSLTGSGQEGSYLLVLSSSAADNAILVDNNAAGAIFYANNGGIELKNNIVAKEVTGYKVKLDNNAVIQYESGLANILFTNGPAGGWRVTSWQEQ